MSKSRPSSMYEACENWLAAFGAYTNHSEPPLGPENAAKFHALKADLRSAMVYYPASQPFPRVQAYMSMRIPCQMGRTILTDIHSMTTQFGIDKSFYHSPQGFSEAFGGPPMCGVYTRTEVTVRGESFPLSVYHMIGPDMSDTMTPDFLALTKQGRESGLITGRFLSESNDNVLFHLLSLRHALMWYLAFVAARDHGFKKIADVKVGGGAFLFFGWEDRFLTAVHNAAFYHLGYGTEAFEKEFPGICLVDPPEVVPTSLNQDMDDVLHINAWDHSSFIGNGNRQDRTLDGAWGCIGRFAPLAWPYSNPFMRWRAINTDDLEKSFPPDRPKDRLCGRPHETLLAQRGKGKDAGGGSSSAPPPQEAKGRKRPRAVST